MFPEKAFPLQQGALDSLCAIYSVLNCMHQLGELESVERESVKLAEVLFHRVVRWSGKYGNAAEAACEGFDPVYRAGSAINEIAEKASGRKLLADPVCPESPKDLAARIDKSPKGGLIYFADGNDSELTHYTMVLKRKGAGVFPLYDSYGFKALTVTPDTCCVDGHPVNVTHFWAARPKRTAAACADT